MKIAICKVCGAEASWKIVRLTGTWRGPRRNRVQLALDFSGENAMPAGTHCEECADREAEKRNEKAAAKAAAAA